MILADLTFETLKAGTTKENSDSGAEVARKFNDNFAKVTTKMTELDTKLQEEASRFATMTEAQAWINSHECAGVIVTVHNGTDWTPYIVQDDKSLLPLSSATVEIADITRIDGGTSSDTLV